MENKPPVDRELLIPMIIGIISILGIGLVFSTYYLNRPQAPVPPEPTATPFIYLLLATETATSIPELETSPSDEVFPTAAISTPLPSATVERSVPAGTPSSTNTPMNDGSDFTTAIPPVSEALPIASSKYDDTNPNIGYGGEWTVQSTSGTAYQGTLHISNTIGNYITLTFEGQQMELGYQSASDSGTLVITIDEEEYVLDQFTNNIWVSPKLTSGTHYAIIFHESGDIINLDYINILDNN